MGVLSRVRNPKLGVYRHPLACCSGWYAGHTAPRLARIQGLGVLLLARGPSRRLRRLSDPHVRCHPHHVPGAHSHLLHDDHGNQPGHVSRGSRIPPVELRHVFRDARFCILHGLVWRFD